MTYRQLQALAKSLRNQGLIAKNFKLNQKANILKAAIAEATGQIETAATTKKEEMTQDEFNIKFATLYVEIRKEEELAGVLTIKKPKVEKRFIATHGISARAYKKMYKKVPTLFEVPENGSVMCRIATKIQADGTYKPEH